jgi:hypothetical protein
MNPIRLPDPDALRADPGFGPPLSLRDLGEHAALLVWESYSDFMTSEPLPRLLDALALAPIGEVAHAPVARELLMYHLWLHFRAIHLGFMARGGPVGDANAATEALCEAFFHDAAEAGVSRERIPTLRAEVALRLKEYSGIAKPGLEAVGVAVVAHMIPPDPPQLPPLTLAAAARTLAAHGAELSEPFQDFVASVPLATDGGAGEATDGGAGGETDGDPQG